MAVAIATNTEAHIRKWPWEDPWKGAAITEGSAIAQSKYALEMHDAAMRGRLSLFDQPRNPQ